MSYVAVVHETPPQLREWDTFWWRRLNFWMLLEIPCVTCSARDSPCNGWKGILYKLYMTLWHNQIQGESSVTSKNSISSTKNISFSKLGRSFVDHRSITHRAKVLQAGSKRFPGWCRWSGVSGRIWNKKSFLFLLNPENRLSDSDILCVAVHCQLQRLGALNNKSKRPRGRLPTGPI